MQDGKLHQVFGVTNAFFAAQPNISFLSNSFAFINGCQSDDYLSPGVRGFLAILRAKNVGTYLGWSKEAAIDDARETANFVFDRWLGEQTPQVTMSVLAGIAGEPARNFQIVELLAPDQSGERLALDHALVGRDDILLQVGVIDVGFGTPLRHASFEALEGFRHGAPRQPQAILPLLLAGDGRLIPHPRLGADLRGIDPIGVAWTAMPTRRSWRQNGRTARVLPDLVPRSASPSIDVVGAA